MKLLLATVGKKHDKHIIDIVNDYSLRISKYMDIQWHYISPAKKATIPQDIKKEEEKNILDFIEKDDYFILLDETGTNINSVAFANKLQQVANDRYKRLIILIGGAYGVTPIIKQKAHFMWSLSQLVFPHMLVRCILAEQVYRACTILKNEKYHH
jgi:23S rRNA (pseudouridine1915-N3)-methyltransferase